MASPSDDRVKLYTTRTLLQARRANEAVFQFGSYEPLSLEGSRREHAFAFARRYEGREVVVVVPRLVAALVPDADMPPLGERTWGDTRLRLPHTTARCYRHALTDRCLPVENGDLRAADIFAQVPVAVLEAQ